MATGWQGRDERLGTASGVVLQVEDTGPGIPEAERNRVLGNDEVGSGLGLSIVQTIGAQLGASISLDYTNEQTKSGLRVTVNFPAMDASSPRPQACGLFSD